MLRQKIVFIFFIGFLTASCSTSKDWRTASRASAGLAPDPHSHHDAVVQVYGADAWGWRGWFAVHTWIAVKRTGETNYTVYDVVGWRGRWGQPVLASSQDIPDRHWFGARPEILVEHRGAAAEELIAAIEQAVHDYPWKNKYTAFPGPNSNTFVAWVGKKVPKLQLKLPFSAIGSGFIDQ